MERAHAVAFAFASTLGACSLVTSLDGLSSGAPTPSGTDGATDGPSDQDVVMTTDASPPADVVPAGPFCSRQAPKPYFCADFDDGDAGLPAPFDREIIQGKGSITLDGTRSVSPPRALLSTIGPAVASGAALGLRLPSAASVTIDFDVAVESTGTVGYDFLTVAAPGGFELGLELNGNGVSFENERLEDGGAGSKVPTTGRVDANFTHVTFVLRAEGAGATMDATIGQARFSSPVPPSILKTPEILIGDDAHQLQESATWRVRFDNVVVRHVPN